MWAWLLLLAVVVATTLFAACGGDDDGDNPDAQEVTEKVNETIGQPGMVYHAELNDGSEVWIDAANQEYRKKDSNAEGNLISIGKGYTQVYYDPFANQVATKDLSSSAQVTPRINNPAVSWVDALSALGYAAALELTATSVIDGIEVWVLQASTPILNSEGQQVAALNARVEIDTKTNLPHAYEKREIFADGSTPTPNVAGVPTNRRLVYTTSEMITRDSLADDWFDEAIVGEQIQSPEQNLEKVAALGLTPMWLGVHYEGPGGILELPEDTGIFAIRQEETAEIHYSLIVPVSGSEAVDQPDSVIVRLAKTDSEFDKPSIPEFGGTLPEQEQVVTVNGTPGLLYTSTLTSNDLPCPQGNCPPSNAALYRRLIFRVGETGIQLETAARTGAARNDVNGYNTRDGIVALAEALLDGTDVAGPTPSPSPLGPVR